MSPYGLQYSMQYFRNTLQIGFPSAALACLRSTISLHFHPRGIVLHTTTAWDISSTVPHEGNRPTSVLVERTSGGSGIISRSAGSHDLILWVIGSLLAEISSHVEAV